MDVSKLTIKHQVTIPADVRATLGVKAGDHVAFEIEDGKVLVRKARPVDRAWAVAISTTLTEWSSEEDEQAFRDL